MKETKVQGTKPVDKDKQAAAQADETEKNAVSPEVNAALKKVSTLSWGERKDFQKKFGDVFNQEADMRSGGNEFDEKKYVPDAD